MLVWLTERFCFLHHCWSEIVTGSMGFSLLLFISCTVVACRSPSTTALAPMQTYGKKAVLEIKFIPKVLT